MLADPGRIGRAARGVTGIARRRRLDPPVRFLVLTPGRSGSTLLMSMLGSTPHIRCDREVLRTATGDATRLLQRRARRAAVGGARAWGTAVHPEHLLTMHAAEPTAWAAELHDDGYQLITLVRRNLLHHVLSAALAWQRGVWHYTDGTETSHEPIELDVMEVLRAAGEVDRSARLVQRMAANRSHLALRYEDDLRDEADHQSTCNRVFEFLGLPSTPVETALRRRPVGLLEQIANADELIAALRATRHAEHLDDLDV